jgi:hypothetical protein
MKGNVIKLAQKNLEQIELIGVVKNIQVINLLYLFTKLNKNKENYKL